MSLQGEDAPKVDAAPKPGDRRFLAGFALANVGAFVSFLPLLQILTPLKAAQIAPAHPAELLGEAAAVGAVVAGVANFAVGWLSDRSRSRFGRRRPWIVAGALGVAASYALIWAAGTPLGLVLGLCAFQLALNTLFAPLLALLPDRVAGSRRGWASALFALGHPVGTAVGAVAIGVLFTREGDRYLALAAIVLVAIVPFALSLSPDPARPLDAEDGPAREAERAGLRLSRDFVLGWVGRTGVLIALSMTQTFLLFYLQRLAGPVGERAAERDVALFGVVFGMATAASALACGRASDRVGRRRPFVIAGALAVGVGMVALALAPSRAMALAAYGLFALGAGCHTATDFALMVGLLPSRDRAARDLGVLNLSNIAPQVIAPLLASLTLRWPGADIRWVFAMGGLSAAAGALLVGLMRRAR